VPATGVDLFSAGQGDGSSRDRVTRPGTHQKDCFEQLGPRCKYKYE